MTAFSYIRFSSAKQELGHSLKRQHEKAVAWCKANNIELSDKSFKDLGISGFRDKKRPSLDDMFDAIENGSIKAGDIIVLECLDRLSRKGIDDTRQMIREILLRDVEIMDLSNNLRLNRDSLNDMVSDMRIAVAADLAHKESRNKSIRVQAAKSNAAELAKAGVMIKRRLPFWLSWKDDQVVLNDKSEIITMAINWRLAGRGLQGIAKDLNLAGHESPNGKGWSDQTVRYVFENATLYGTYRQKDGNLIADYYPAVTDYETWKAIQPHKISRVGGHSHKNKISGCTVCSMCGKAFKLKTLTKKRGKKSYVYRYWVCRGRESATCEQDAIRDLDLLVDEHIQELVVPALDSDNSKIDSQIDALKLRIAELETGLASGLSVAVFLKLIEDCNQKIRELTDQRVETVSKKDLAMLSSIDDPVEFNIMLRRIVKSIEVGSTYVKISRVDGHSIRFSKSGTGLIESVTDTKAFSNYLKELNDEHDDYYE